MSRRTRRLWMIGLGLPVAWLASYALLSWRGTCAFRYRPGPEEPDECPDYLWQPAAIVHNPTGWYYDRIDYPDRVARLRLIEPEGCNLLGWLYAPLVRLDRWAWHRESTLPPNAPELPLLQRIRLDTLHARRYMGNDEYPGRYFREADELVRQGRWQEAYEIYQRVVMEYPHGHCAWQAWFWVTVCRDHLGTLSDKRKSYQRYLDDNTVYGRYARSRIEPSPSPETP